MEQIFTHPYVEVFYQADLSLLHYRWLPANAKMKIPEYKEIML